MKVPHQPLNPYTRAKKVLFGSNYPMLTPGACLKGLDALALDAPARARFLADNARRVFRLPAP